MGAQQSLFSNASPAMQHLGPPLSPEFDLRLGVRNGNRIQVMRVFDPHNPRGMSKEEVENMPLSAKQEILDLTLQQFRLESLDLREQKLRIYRELTEGKGFNPTDSQKKRYAELLSELKCRRKAKTINSAMVENPKLFLKILNTRLTEEEADLLKEDKLIGGLTEEEATLMDNHKIGGLTLSDAKQLARGLIF